MNKMPEFYVPPYGTPLYWRDEVSGVLPAAVDAYFSFVLGEGPEPTAEQLSLLLDYIRYHINAPCWGDVMGKLELLREQARALATVDDIRKYINSSLEIGLDPF